MRRAIIVAGLGVLVTLAGCSAVRLGYNQAPQLAMWWLDGYLDFDSTQSPRVREALQRWFAWHRATQLPEYAAMLSRVQAQAAGPLTGSQVCGWAGEVRERLDPLSQQALPMVADLAPLVTAAQVARLEQRFARSNEKFREDILKADAAERLKAQIERAVDRFENVYGRLDDAQRARVAAGVRASAGGPEQWYADRLARQAEVLQTLRRLLDEKADRARAQALLGQVFDRMQGASRWDTRGKPPAAMAAQCEWIAEVHNATTPAQRQRARERLRGWEQDFRALASQAAPTVQAATSVR